MLTTRGTFPVDPSVGTALGGSQAWNSPQASSWAPCPALGSVHLARGASRSEGASGSKGTALGPSRVANAANVRSTVRTSAEVAATEVISALTWARKPCTCHKCGKHCRGWSRFLPHHGVHLGRKPCEGGGGGQVLGQSADPGQRRRPRASEKPCSGCRCRKACIWSSILSASTGTPMNTLI